MQCTVKKTLELAKLTGNALIVQVKRNQKQLYNDCQKASKQSEARHKFISPLEKHHGRIEKREIEVFRNFQSTLENKCKGSISDMIKVSRTKKIFNTKTKKWEDKSEVSFYVSTHEYDAQDYYKLIRMHWKIENNNHYIRDEIMKEDCSRIRRNPINMAILKSFALNILRANAITNIANSIYTHALNSIPLFSFLGISTH